MSFRLRWHWQRVRSRNWELLPALQFMAFIVIAGTAVAARPWWFCRIILPLFLMEQPWATRLAELLSPPKPPEDSWMYRPWPRNYP